MERLLEAGALDVTLTPVQMKKNRPGTMLSVIASPESQERLAQIVLRETSTLGLRVHTVERRVQQREFAEVETPRPGADKAFAGWFVCPEFDDCRKLAMEHGVPLKQVIADANAAFRAAEMKYYITTPIYYVNAAPHIGHTYTTIAADAFKRVKTMQGFEAYITTGTDEHGQKIERAAKAAGQSEVQFTDVISNEFRQQWKELDLEVDYFRRTSDPKHHKAVQDLFKKCLDNGFIYKGSYTGQYCVFDEL
ncbi:MAG: nickel insertion protein, partial [Bryobacteraceae bacterium]